MAVHEIEDKLGSQAFKPHLKPGQLPGQVGTLLQPATGPRKLLGCVRLTNGYVCVCLQETLRVAAWSVDDVARWLQVQ